MKKRILWQRFLSLMMALTVAASLPLTAFAEEITGTVDVETTAGNTEPVDVVISIESTPTSDGGTNVQTSTEAAGAVVSSGLIVDYQGSSDMTTDADNNTTGTADSAYTVENSSGTYSAEGGSQLSQEAAAPEATVEVPLTEGSENTAKGTEEGTTSVTGDVKTSEQDGNYDYTKETVIQQGSVTITTEEITTETLDAEDSEHDYQDDLEYTRSEAIPTEDNDLFIETSSDAVIPESKEDLPEIKEGYGYVYLGSENSSEYFAATLFTKPQYEGEKPTYTIDGVDYYTGRTGLTKEVYENYLETGNGIHSGFVVDGLYIDGEKVSDEKFAMAWGSVQQFLMANGETGELNTVYCADQRTYATEGFSYNIENLEDASYYNDAEAAHIRTIAENGYWGTDEGVGSLENMREMMRAAQDENGNAVFTEEEISLLNDGVAMTATQFAIWNYSNVNNHVKYVNVNYIHSGEDMARDVYQYNHMGDVPAEKKPEEALIFKLSNYLINMEPTEIETPTTSNTVMTAENFVKDLSVTVVEKAEDHVNNTDTDVTNDAYVTELNFALVVTPSTENGDDMIVKIVSNGETLGEYRLAGENKDGQDLEILTCDANGNYTVKDLVLTEGNQQFNITLEGIQNLKEGVYLYTSEVRPGQERETSQTMLGMAGGEHAVNVSMTINFQLDVDDEVVATEHIWREEWTAPSEPPYDPPYDPPAEEEPVPFRMRRQEPAEDEDEEEDDALVTIPEEPVPLAKAPSTGDVSAVYAVFAAVSGLSLAGLHWKKREED